MTSEPLLSVEDLQITFEGDRGRMTPVVTGISFDVGRGETVAIVGESGCGKSVTALSILRLLPKQTARIAGRIKFEGRDLQHIPERDMQALRGNRLAMVFQEPMTSLNPSYTVGDQIAEPLQRHRALSASQARKQSINLLQQVRIPLS